MTADRAGEDRITELEATASGLTEELIELKERVRLLEAEVEPDSQGDARTKEFGATKPVESKGSDENTTGTGDSEGDDEIIVA